MTYPYEGDLNQAAAFNYGGSLANIANQTAKPPLQMTLDETHELLCKCEQAAHELALRILGPRPELMSGNAPSAAEPQPPSSLRRTADNINDRARAVAAQLERITNGI